METNKYSIFLKILECRSFSAAADELGYTQSAVSHSVSSLEKQFGFKLLNREGGNFGLTRAGLDMLPYIRSVEKAQQDLESMLQSFQEFEKGTLCIATVPSITIHFFPEILRTFREKYPQIHIIVLDGNYEEVEEMLAGDRVDFGITSVTPDMPFQIKVLMRDELVAVLPVGHPLSDKEILSLKDLEPYDFIMPGEGPTHQIGALIQDYNLNLQRPFAVSDDNLTMAMVADGLGVSVLPALSCKKYLNFDVVIRKLAENPYRDLGIIYRNWESISPISRNFIHFLEMYFRTRDLEI